jgi:hypothetical protein
MFKRFIFLAILVFLVTLIFVARNRKITEAPKKLQSQAESTETIPPVVNTAYENGRVAGHYAFLKQVGQYIPMPKAAKYSVNMGDDEEEFNKGYVDGYHRAAESLHCPREDHHR